MSRKWGDAPWQVVKVDRTEKPWVAISRNLPWVVTSRNLPFWRSFNTHTEAITYATRMAGCLE